MFVDVVPVDTKQNSWLLMSPGQRFKKPKPFIEVSLNAVVERNLTNIGEATALDIDGYIEDNYAEIG